MFPLTLQETCLCQGIGVATIQSAIIADLFLVYSAGFPIVAAVKIFGATSAIERLRGLNDDRDVSAPRQVYAKLRQAWIDMFLLREY